MVFEEFELRLTSPPLLRAFSKLPAAQVHDAYDADRNGVYVRLSAKFTHAQGQTVTVPGFAVKERPGAPWTWRIRWSPYRRGIWHMELAFEGRAAPEGVTVRFSQKLPEPVPAWAAQGIDGALVAPNIGHNPRFLCYRHTNGESDALWLFAARAVWATAKQNRRLSPARNGQPAALPELLAALRTNGFDLLETSPETWRAYRCGDEARARAFDKLLRQCAGSSWRRTVRLLVPPFALYPRRAVLSPAPPAPPAGSAVPAFAEVPRRGQGSDLDRAANFLRYVFARWGYSRAVGLWVLPSEAELAACGLLSAENAGDRRDRLRRGRATVEIAGLFHGGALRRNGPPRLGDPYQHPLLFAVPVAFPAKDGLRAWKLPAPGLRTDAAGVRQPLPSCRGRQGGAALWRLSREFAAYSHLLPEKTPRLFLVAAPENGEPRAAGFSPDDEDFRRLARWAALFAGYAATPPFDFRPGRLAATLKEGRAGNSKKEAHPGLADGPATPLRRFFGKLNPHTLIPTTDRHAVVKCAARGLAVLFALYKKENARGVYGLFYVAAGAAGGNRAGAFSLSGLPRGKYRLSWYDPRTGGPLRAVPSRLVKTDRHGSLSLGLGAMEVFPLGTDPFRVGRGRGGQGGRAGIFVLRTATPQTRGEL